MNLTAWTPKSLLALREYNGRKLGADVTAGVTVGLVALPLSMAFAIASGAPPEAGLYTAVVAGFAVSALGGSRTQIAGPTGAFVVIVAGILARLWVRWPAGMHHHGRLPADCAGSHRPGRGGQVHSPPGDRGFHQRHRHPHRQHPDQRLFRTPDRARAWRFCGPPAGGAGACAHGFSHHDGPIRVPRWCSSCSFAAFCRESPATLSPWWRRPWWCTSRICRSRPLAPGSAAFPQAFPASMCRCSITPPCGR